MAARIKRGGQRIRGADGGRTRNEECCCDQPTCGEVNTDSIRETWEISYELEGITFSTAGCGANCTSSAPLSGVLPYFLAANDEDWRQETAISGCTSTYEVVGRLLCVSGVVTLEVILFLLNPDSTSNWSRRWTLDIPIADFFLGTEYQLERGSGIGAGTACVPTAPVGTSICRAIVS